MTKIIRTYSIDDKYLKELKKINASDLINELLDKHFEFQKKKCWKLEDLELLVKLQEDKERIEKEIKQLELKYG